MPTALRSVIRCDDAYLACTRVRRSRFRVSACSFLRSLRAAPVSRSVFVGASRHGGGAGASRGRKSGQSALNSCRVDHVEPTGQSPSMAGETRSCLARHPRHILRPLKPHTTPWEGHWPKLALLARAWLPRVRPRPRLWPGALPRSCLEPAPPFLSIYPSVPLSIQVAWLGEPRVLRSARFRAQSSGGAKSPSRSNRVGSLWRAGAGSRNGRIEQSRSREADLPLRRG